MATFIYRCPFSGLRVQGLVADEVGAELGDDTFTAISCTACGQLHFVNPTSGKVVGEEDEDES